MEQEAIDRAMEVMGPLEENPQGWTMSRAGAEACVLNIADCYEEEMGQMGIALRPKRVKEEFLEIAEKAEQLRNALMISTDSQTILFIFCHADVNHQDTTLLELFDDIDNPKYVGNVPRKTCKLRSNILDTEEPRLPQRPPELHYSPSPWVARLECLEAIARKAAEDPRLKDGGGKHLRALPKWVGTPNYQLVTRCRALLAACGKSCGGSKRGNLVKLLSAVAGKERSIETTFNNDIREVLANPLTIKWHEAAVERLILSDRSTRFL